MDEPRSPLDFAPAPSAAALRELRQRAQSLSVARREQMTRLEAQISRQLQVLAETLAEQQAAEETAAADREAARAELQSLREHLDQRAAELDEQAEQLAERESQLLGREQNVEQGLSQVDEKATVLRRKEQELDEKLKAAKSIEAQHEAAWQAEREALEKQRSEAQATIERLTQQLETATKADAEKQTRLDSLSARVEEVEAESAKFGQQWNESRIALEHERDELQLALCDAKAGAVSAQGFDETVAERDELKQKFALALEDIQRFKTRVTDLEQELARRPKASNADSAELVALRAERDELAARLEKLESEPAVPADSVDAQQLADLQRRFELAVEDVRELKTKNGRLEAQLAAVRKQSGGQVDGNGMDWESQKRRLLASLEGDAADEPERASVASTIQITDAVVAEKDAEISRLKAQLAEAASAGAATAMAATAMDELLSTDEVIQQHRERFAQLEQEMESKLRAAELELSVERAKIARQKSELEQLRLELEAQRNSLVADGAAAMASGPRRRWLSKLGLGGDEQ
jgi:chromosome segregation ATPase